MFIDQSLRWTLKQLEHLNGWSQNQTMHQPTREKQQLQQSQIQVIHDCLQNQNQLTNLKKKIEIVMEKIRKISFSYMKTDKRNKVIK